MPDALLGMDVRTIGASAEDVVGCQARMRDWMQDSRVFCMCLRTAPGSRCRQICRAGTMAIQLAKVEKRGQFSQSHAFATREKRDNVP
jgi:hypothetical protein